VSMQKKRKFLSEEEFHNLLSYVKGQADSARKKGSSRAVIDEIIINILLIGGLRAKELCSLRIRDVPVIHSENSIWIRNSNEQVVRKILINEEFVDLLERFVTIYRKKANQQDFLLQSERGNPFSYFSLYCKIKRIETNSGIGPLSPAVLRHTYVIRLYNAEQDLRYVQDQAGYTSYRSIAPYLNSDQADKNVEMPQICEACSAKIVPGCGKRIESGQFLCQDCLKYFRESKP
jgi:integrase/recombinase XerD